MKKILLYIFICLPVFITAQNNKISLEDLNKDNTFKIKRVGDIKSMNDGIHYTSIVEGNKIVKFEYNSGNKISELMNLSEIKDCPIDNIQGYCLNPTETKILIYNSKEQIYRHTFKANYYLYDIKRKEIVPISKDDKQLGATFSPNGEMIAFVKNNDIYIYKIKFGTETRVTKDGEVNKIMNGIPDWVYEEEFSFNKAMEWSPNSMELAYLRFDESDVKQYSFPMYKGSHPTHDEFSLYPGEYTYKYPKSGEKNSVVTVNVFHIKNRTTKTMDTGDGDYYIPRIKWTMEDGKLGIIKLNRSQDQIDLMIANTASTLAKSIFTYRSEYYISEDVLNNITFLNDGKHFIYVGELDGYNHIHLYSMAGLKIRQITQGKWDVTDFYGFDENKGLLFYQAAASSPLQREVYSIRLDGKKKTKLTTLEGINNATFSSNYKYFINEYSSTTTPNTYTVCNQMGKSIRTIEDNNEITNKLNDYQTSKKEFFTFSTSQGIKLNGWMVKPLNFDPDKKYPVLMTQYSGPNSQSVLDEWRIGWEQYLASEGFVVACVDPRGTGARGEEFKKSTYLKLGKYESEDQIEAAKYLGSLKFCDESRIAIWGWSYGGFMACNCLSRADGIFKVGIAVAPVTNWRYYDSAYTERFMRKPQENPKGYDENSPINMAENLSGRLFLIHGTADDNVHFQNTLEYAEQLIQANKQFDMFVYPNRNHNITGGNTRLHLYRMMSDYLKRNL